MVLSVYADYITRSMHCMNGHIEDTVLHEYLLKLLGNALSKWTTMMQKLVDKGESRGRLLLDKDESKMRSYFVTNHTTFREVRQFIAQCCALAKEWKKKVKVKAEFAHWDTLTSKIKRYLCIEL